MNKNSLVSWLLFIGLIFSSVNAWSGEAKKEKSKTYERAAVEKCIQDQIELYSDVCAESDDDDTKLGGVNCVVESIKICLGGLK